MSGALNKISYVFLGGFLGTLARFFASEIIAFSNPNQNTELFWLYVVNLLGALFFGITAKHPAFSSENCKNLWGVGFAGGFTTMSAVTTYLDFHGLFDGLVGLMMILGLGLYGFGYHFGRRAAKRSQDG